MKVKRILLILLAVLFVASLPLGRSTRSDTLQTGEASGPAPAQTLTPQPDPPGTIDGSKNPELIPDDEAYRLVLFALAEPENATDAQKARFRAKIASASLNEDDTQALFGVLATFQSQLDALSAQEKPILARNPIMQAGTPDYQKLVDLTQQMQPVFNQALSALPARLSTNGITKLQAYVRGQKRGMKYLPDAPMTKP